MTFIKRTMLSKLTQVAQYSPVVAILGPRQSGKTTLSKAAFPNHRYVNLENLVTQKNALEDPLGFLESLENPHGIILDEVQNVPDLFSYIQVASDANERKGYYILTGSHNYLLNEKISQSLAGRVSIQTLLPLTTGELKAASRLPQDVYQAILNGMYPRIYDDGINPSEWYQNYIHTFVQRDVRLIRNIEQLSLFTDFIALCAGRIGQLLNISSLSVDCGVSVATIRAWLSILESSYVLYLFRPYHKNYSKRLIKSPKIFFYDTGLACNLLGINSVDQLMKHYLRGGLFESFIMSELHKIFYNKGTRPPLYYWRDKTGHEVDCIIEDGQDLTPIEIKASKTMSPDYFVGLNFWYKMTETTKPNGYLVYGGAEPQKWKSGSVIGWSDVGNLIK